MARTFVQQSQISGSLVFNDVMGTGAAELASKQTLVGDLDALRSQINKIVGGERWYDALSGSQNLADIYAALQVTGADASFQGAMDVAGVADFDSAVFMASDLGVSGSLVVAGLADLNGALEVAGVADFASAAYMASDLGVSGSLTVAGLSDLNGALEVAGVADFASAVYAASDLGVSGSLTVAGPATMNDGLTVSGDRLEVTGSMGITGAVDFDSTLNVDGVADFKADVYMAAALGVSGSASVAGALDADSLEVAGLSDLNGALEVAGVADFASDVYMAAALGVSGSASVAGALEVAGVADFASDVFMAASLGVSGSLDVAGDVTAVSGSFSGDVDVTGNLDVNATISADTIKIDSDTPTRLYIVGDGGELKDEAKLTFASDLLTVDGDAHIKGDLIVDQDLRVKGSMTYIDTTNLRVQDAFIYLATGSQGTTDSGIVLHGGAGFDGVNTIDLVMGQDGGAGEFIFGKGNRGPDGEGAMDGIALVPAWMSEIKLGGLEGSLSGSFAATAAGAELSSSADLRVEATGDMTLSANSNDIGLMSGAEYTEFDGNFDATTIVGALNELFDMIGGGSAAKGDLSVANVATNTLTFSSIGTLTAAEHKLVDVYLNGVLLSPSRDLSNLTTTAVDLDSAIASGLMADDVITVVIRSAV